MRDVMLMLVAWASVAGCATSSMMVRSPVQQQCAREGLRRCRALADGIVLYLDGRETEARLNLKQAVAKNSPEQLRAFVTVMEETVPGAAGAEIAELLSAELQVALASPPPAEDAAQLVTASRLGHPAPSALASVPSAVPADDEEHGSERAHSVVRGGEPVLLALAASVDPSRLLTESITPLRDASRHECEVLGKPSVCVRRQAGPMVLTDVIAPAGCTMELYVGAAGLGGKLRWAFPVGPSGTHGAHFFVRGDEQLTVAVRGGTLTQPGDVRCAAVWSGFRPRIVPMMPGTNAATLAP